MKTIIVIGGRGKIGSFLVPMLVRAGWAVTNVSRGQQQPLVADDAWPSVRQLTLDRRAPDFARQIVSIAPDAVIDLICYENADMVQLLDALHERVGHYLVCGSAWIHGHSTVVPVREDECRTPLEHYGEQKLLMDETITARFRQSGFPGTAVHPGHIVCPGVPPINPQGFAGLDAFRTLRAGEPLSLPNLGMETLHHVHAADVAGVFLAALTTGRPAFGEGFHAVSPPRRHPPRLRHRSRHLVRPTDRPALRTVRRLEAPHAKRAERRRHHRVAPAALAQLFDGESPSAARVCAAVHLLPSRA